MDKFDVKKSHKALYAPSAKEFSLVEVPLMRYLAIDGHGDPNGAPGYLQALEALYAASYALKFHSKKVLGRDYVVAPLEGHGGRKTWLRSPPAMVRNGTKPPGIGP